MSSGMHSYIPAPVLVEYKGLKFVIAGAPEKYRIYNYVEELARLGTKRLVKVSEDVYNVNFLIQSGIPVEEFLYPNGTFPSHSFIDRWMDLVQRHFAEFPGSALAVHDHAGLGRAPVLVAIAFNENGLKMHDAIQLIRSKRKGCFNARQYEELLRYKPRGRLKRFCRF